ncbi:TetR/AcrR family transcriptional regulator [Streptosporangium sp. NPDC004379]|uniref:TetR/AcrR family transcriptional regulator n=1 Tax=Streptosporangium sp. NPDC004379 TaxID=3366189 RepID=UPI0036B0DB84
MGGRYHSPRREDAAAETRAAILACARELFLERGYGATTVPEIARAAQVATQTVYTSAGGKAAMFAELLRPAINDPAAAAAGTAARSADDPVQVLTLCARAARHGQERYWDLIYKLMRYPPDEALAQQAIANITAKCLEALTAIARRLWELNGLRPEITVTDAVDVLWFHFGQNAWCSLVGDRGWTFDRAERWLLRAAGHELLTESHVAMLDGPA